MKDSVHQLLRDQITALGLESYFEVLNDEIRGVNGSLFVFAGLRHNIDSIKSKEGIDIVWVEEAETVSRSSWAALIPTVRKDRSEIWISFNPDLDTAETFRRFVLNPPPDAIVVKLNWSDNPFFPEVLRREMEHLKATDPDAYLNVWEGHCKQTLDGAIYAKEIRTATEEGRITRVPYDPTKPVHTFWDLGWADSTSIWFAQSIAFETRIIDHYRNSQHPLAHYQQVLQNRGYVYGTHYLPHDARAKQIGTGKSVEELMRTAGFKVLITPQLSVADGINATRTMFANFWFDQEKCSDGLQSLRRYRYDVDPDTKQFSRQPLHDDASHDADGLRYLAVALRAERKPAGPAAPARQRRGPVANSGAWMG